MQQSRHIKEKAAPRGRPFHVALSMAAATTIVLHADECRAQIDEALRGRLADHRATLQLERALADLLASNDRAALRRFGQGVRRDDGGTVLDFWQRVRAGDRKAAEANLTLNACHRAGIDMRLLAMAVAEGKVKVKVLKRGTAFITEPNDLGEELGAKISRCEVVSRMPLSERRIGTNCLHTGQDCQ